MSITPEPRILPPGRSPLLRLFKMLRPFWRGMAMAVALGALTILSSVGLMATSAWLISKAGLRPSIADLGVSVVMVRFLGIGRGVFRYLERLIAHETTFRLLAGIRVALYKALEPLAPARLSQHSSGDLLSRVIADVETLQDVYLRVIAPPLVALVTGLVAVSLYAVFDPFLALIVLAGLVLIGVGLPLLTYSLGREPGKTRIEARTQLNAALVDGIQGMAESLLYGYTLGQDQKLIGLSESLERSEWRMAFLDGLQSTLNVLIVNGTALGVLVVAIPRVEGIYLAALTLACMATFEAVTPLGLAAAHLGAALSAAQRLFGIADQSPAVSEPLVPVLPPTDTTIRFENVSFVYAPDEPPVLDHLNLDISPQAKIAILGESGAGKSTLAQLLVRFWDCDQGRISFGGGDIRTYGLGELRAQFGVMTQRVHLFNTTLRENIRLGRGDASDEQVVTAAGQAVLHGLIERLPEGYETLVGENGARLSGGERQRVALARVLLKDAPVWILDECTANLDTHTERALLETIFEAAAERTLIFLTHRRILLDRMDQVYLLHQGQIQRFEG